MKPTESAGRLRTWEAIGSDLISMAEEDQRIRAELASDGSLFRGTFEGRPQRAAAEKEGEKPPPDWQARRQDLECWCREVGWRT